jgi:hypothetical protein
MTRREALAAMAGAAMPASTPPGVAAIIQSTLRQDPASLNTDWFGTLLVKGLLEWGRKHVPAAGPFAKAWIGHHLRSGRLAPFQGAKSRTVTAGGIPITTYAGHYGLALPCFEIHRQFGDERVRAVCLDIADIVLHQAARNRLGLVAHDDHADFAIPDTCYFAASALMIGSRLDERRAEVYRAQAVFQLRTYIDTFLDRSTGLAKTILFPNGLGKTYWTRATGWLLWSMAAVMRDLPSPEPFTRDLEALAGGIARFQDASGALRLYVNEPESPLETTGTAMCAMGLHEAVRRGWLAAKYTPVVERAWKFVAQNITPEGDIRRAYTLWAVPAERRQVELDGRKMGWIPGFILSTAYEMSAA